MIFLHYSSIHRFSLEGKSIGDVTLLTKVHYLKKYACKLALFLFPPSQMNQFRV